MDITVGYFNQFGNPIQSLISEATKNSFDFILTPLCHPKRSDFIPFSGVLLSNFERCKIAVFIPQRNYGLQKNVILLRKELTYALHIGIFHIVIECPQSFQSIEILAVEIERKLKQIEMNRVSISLKISIFDSSNISSEHRANSNEISVDHSWEKWNHFRRFVQTNPTISLALELTGELPCQERIKRWLGEPIMVIFLPTTIFLTNASGNPVLSKNIQNFLQDAAFHMAKNLSFVIKGKNLHNQLRNYVDYINHLKNNRFAEGKISEYCRGYEDLLQIPLQPLKDNLDSSVYEAFETDVIKYQQYEQAIYEALNELEKEQITVMVMGAGRGPLVEKAMLAAKKAQKSIKIFAIEKNPYAIITLNLLKDLKWGGNKGLSQGSVDIISCDMRNWNAPEKADLVVSELLGSFGDNELSPECLDGLSNCTHSKTLCIPYSYTSYLSPVQSQRLYSRLSNLHRSNGNPYEHPYVVHVRNAYLIDEPKAVFHFEHHDLSHPVVNKRKNYRKNCITFKSKIKTCCHGFVGYFDCFLYKNIRLSIVPSTQNFEMYSWFPIYLPIENPIDLNESETIQLNITRNIDELNVWYEWTVLKPNQSKVHNLNGKCYSISLH